MTAFALGLLATLTPTVQAAEGGRWIDDFDEAVKIAKAEHKDLLVDFTGSDWCGWCIKLHKEVFSHEPFYTTAEKSFVLVALDFPRDEAVKAKVPNPERNRELANLYGVQGYPTVLLMTADGEVFGQTGYQAGGPEAYIEHLNTLTTEGKASLAEVAKLVDAFQKAEGEAKIAAFTAVLEGFESREADAAGMKTLADVLKGHLTSDSKDEQGMNERVIKALLKKGQADEAVNAAAAKLDPKNEKGLLEQVLHAKFMSINDEDAAKAAVAELKSLDAMGPIKDEEAALDMYFSAAWLCSERLEMPDDAKFFAEKAKAVCPASEQRRLEFLDQILNG
ncbi:MAG: thioredoxin family protein [Planctomycetes bacterium]|nr:thioredoxin family protein [Planctomycetota bacterium]